MNAFAALQALKEKALENAGLPTFTSSNVEIGAKPSKKTGQYGYRVLCDDGVTTLTFWESNMHACLDDLGDGRMRVKPDVVITADGGLIPKESQSSNGYWS